MIRNYLLLLTLTAFLLTTAKAQQGGNVEFTCVVWNDLKVGDLYYRDKDEPKLLTLRKGTRSSSYKMKAVSEFQLYIKEIVDEQETLKLVGKSVLPVGADRALILIEEKKTAEGLPLTVLSINDSTSTFSRGAFQVINFFPRPIGVTINQKTTQVEPQKIKIIKPKLPVDGGLIPFLLLDGSKIIYETRLFGQKNDRSTLLVYPSNGARANVRYLTQSLGEPPPEQ